MSFAWDPGFTCRHANGSSLADDVFKEATQWDGNPIITNCSFHSRANMSVVLVGYSFTGLTQSYRVRVFDCGVFVCLNGSY